MIKTCKSRNITGDNIEKIWARRLFAKQKTDVPKARKMAAGDLGSAVSSQWGSEGKALEMF